LDPHDLEAELTRTHASGFAWAVRCCRGDRDEAMDVLHLAYVKVLDGQARFEQRSSFRTWLFGVIRRTALEEGRKRWVRALRLERWRREPRPDQAAPDDRLAADERATRLRQAIGRLSKRQQEVLHLVFYQALTIEEAAGVLGMPVGTARTHYARGKERLRRLLRDEDR
jgi:RNA polymerase sigma-70 factor, ECF subfamily